VPSASSGLSSFTVGSGITRATIPRVNEAELALLAGAERAASGHGNVP
jgi:hypothetical protein